MDEPLNFCQNIPYEMLVTSVNGHSKHEMLIDTWKSVGAYGAVESNDNAFF